MEIILQIECYRLKKNYEIYKNFNVNTFMCMHVYLTKDINVSIYTYNVKGKICKNLEKC